MSKKILITGASSDIGLSISRKFDDPENHLLLHCFKNKEKLENETRAFKASTTIIPCDFTQNDSLEAFVAGLRDVSVIINAAAITSTDLLVNISDNDILKMLQVNILATVKICKALIPQMLAKRSGAIVNISSVAAQRGNRGQTVYGGTKGFLESFSKSLAAEVGTKGIRVNCIAPGAIDAGSIRELLNIAPDEVKKSISLNRLGKPDDIASLVSFLCSDEASFITGQTIHIDGGFQQGI
jgi:3-oxoacyl-[acyl-carrier protein] reductase